MKRINFNTALLFFTILCLTVASTFAQESKTTTGGERYNVNVPDTITMAGKEITITIGTGTLEGRSTKEALLENPFLSVKSTDGLDWKIVSYQINLVRFVENNWAEDPPIMVEGANFPEKIISQIKSAPSGTRIEVTQIKISSSAGTRWVKNGIMAIIK